MMRKTLWALTTRRLDGRSALAVVVRRWKKDVRRDLGGDPPGRRRPFSSWRRSRGWSWTTGSCASRAWSRGSAPYFRWWFSGTCSPCPVGRWGDPD